MKTRNLITSLGGTALVAAALVFSSPASADTQLIHFDDAGNGWAWYSTADGNFTFDPTNFQASSQCADRVDPDEPSEDSCVIEAGQGVLPLMIRPTNQTLNPDGTINQGDAGGNAEPTFAGGDGPGTLLEFTLDSFYFLLTGSDPDGNTMTVCGGTGAPPDPDIETLEKDKDGVPSEICDDQALAFTFSEYGGVTFTGTGTAPGSLPVITYYEGPNAGDVTGTAADPLTFNTGYIATFGDLFADVTWIQWTAKGTNQFRLDCIVATFDGTTNEPYDPATSCGLGEPPNGVPEPGTVALLGLGLVGMGLARRRRKV